MNEGKIFESNFRKSVPSDIFYLRLKDSATSFGQDSVATRFTLRNPYDILMFNGINLFCFELKSTSGTSFSIQFDKKDTSKMIKRHQIDGLTDARKYNKVTAVFVFDFRNSKTWFMSIDKFNSFLSRTTKKSINEKDVIDNGGIVIEKTKKIKNYKYDVNKLLWTLSERE